MSTAPVDDTPPLARRLAAEGIRAFFLFVLISRALFEAPQPP